jgi:hypothetical protein
MCVCVHVFEFVFKEVCLCVNSCMCMCGNLCVYVCVSVHSVYMPTCACVCKGENDREKERK